jgi:hypothetical protein
MVEIDAFKLLEQQKFAGQEVVEQLTGLIQTWDGPIQKALTRLAQVLWPVEYMWGIIPIRAYRLRCQQSDPVTYVWWIEHDIPPYDKYECAAYRVQLTLNDQLQPVLRVESGGATYQVESPTVEELETTVAKGGQDIPLIIPRVMGIVKD